MEMNATQKYQLAIEAHKAADVAFEAAIKKQFGARATRWDYPTSMYDADTLAAMDAKRQASDAQSHAFSQAKTTTIILGTDSAPAIAFRKAIESGTLSANSASARFAGDFMYMGHYNGKDQFKNINTREYVA